MVSSSNPVLQLESDYNPVFQVVEDGKMYRKVGSTQYRMTVDGPILSWE